jgi:hypothetical protein
MTAKQLARGYLIFAAVVYLCGTLTLPYASYAVRLAVLVYAIITTFIVSVLFAIIYAFKKED